MKRSGYSNHRCDCIAWILPTRVFPRAQMWLATAWVVLYVTRIGITSSVLHQFTDQVDNRYRGNADKRGNRGKQGNTGMQGNRGNAGCSI